MDLDICDNLYYNAYCCTTELGFGVYQSSDDIVYNIEIRDIIYILTVRLSCNTTPEYSPS